MSPKRELDAKVTALREFSLLPGITWSEIEHGSCWILGLSCPNHSGGQLNRSGSEHLIRNHPCVSRIWNNEGFLYINTPDCMNWNIILWYQKLASSQTHHSILVWGWLTPLPDGTDRRGAEGRGRGGRGPWDAGKDLVAGRGRRLPIGGRFGGSLRILWNSCLQASVSNTASF